MRCAGSDMATLLSNGCAEHAVDLLREYDSQIFLAENVARPFAKRGNFNLTGMVLIGCGLHKTVIQKSRVMPSTVTFHHYAGVSQYNSGDSRCILRQRYAHCWRRPWRWRQWQVQLRI